MRRQTLFRDRERRGSPGFSWCWTLLVLGSTLMFVLLVIGDSLMGKAARATWVSIWLWCLLGLGVPAGSATPEAPIVNLYRGEINGTLFSAMTADTIRNMFGPPSAIEAPEMRQEGQKMHIQYHALGLSFGMHQPREQTGLQCWRMSIYLTKIWDDKAGKFFLPFPGRLSKQVSHIWNPQRIEAEFRQWYPQSYPQEQAAELVNNDQIVQASKGEYRILYIEFSGFRVDFFYHQTEQRLHSIHLTLHRTMKPEQR